MSALLTKVQYKGFEPGEFTEIAYRSLDDTIELIRNYPWDKQRPYVPVELTCPSVTIQSEEGDMLKLGLGYNNSFKFYWFRPSDKVYSKDVSNLDDAVDIVNNYFNKNDISEGFNKYWALSNYKKHFITKDFTYTVTAKRILLNILGANTINDTLILFFVGMSYLYTSISLTPLIIKIMLGLLWLCASGINYMYLLRYWYLSKHQSIQISRGLDEFTFIDKDSTKQYNKADIACITQNYSIGHSRRRNFFINKVVYNIEMKNGETITFNSLLIPDSVFGNKFPDIMTKRVESYFPKWY